jgi:hypothetical protein
MKKQVIPTVLLFMLFVVPASNNYSLDTYGFGSGGVSNSNSTSYRINANTGELSGQRMSSNSYLGLPGLISTQLANTPTAPTFTNVGNDTNKLLLTINTASNPSDAEYAVAISDDNWVTTEYVQSDNTVGASLGLEDWQTYTAWGSGSGEYVVGLISNTAYKVKVKAQQGDFTEGPWGPEASASTTALSISFDIDVSSTDTETAAPYILAIGSLTPGSVVTASDKIWVDLDTTAEYGAYVYVAGANQGLRSTTQAYTISAISGDLGAQPEGFGLRTATVAQSAGGPLAAVSPYNGASNTVGGPTTVLDEIVSSTAAPITAGRASFEVKAKIKNITPAGSDYAEIITLVAAALY